MIRLQYLTTEHKNHAAIKACFAFGRDSTHLITNSKKRQPLPTTQELVGHYSAKTIDLPTLLEQIGKTRKNQGRVPYSNRVVYRF